MLGGNQSGPYLQGAHSLVGEITVLSVMERNFMFKELKLLKCYKIYGNNVSLLSNMSQ